MILPGIKKITKVLAAAVAAVMFVSVMPVSAAAGFSTGTPSLSKDVEYQAFMQSFAWQPWESDALIAGLPGRSKRMEAFRVMPGSADKNAVITYQAYIQDIGWQAPVTNGQIAGTIGKKKRIQAIRITTYNSKSTTITYRAYIQTRGWTDWLQTATNTPIAKATIVGNTRDPLPIEAIQVIN